MTKGEPNIKLDPKFVAAFENLGREMFKVIGVATGMTTRSGVPARQTHSWLRKNLFRNGDYVESCIRCGVSSASPEGRRVCPRWS